MLAYVANLEIYPQNLDLYAIAF